MGKINRLLMECIIKKKVKKTGHVMVMLECTTLPTTHSWRKNSRKEKKT